MRAPRTPSPTRGKGEDDDAAESPSASVASSAASELSMPDTTSISEAPEKTSQKRSTLWTMLIWVFCLGLLFFTAESIRYALKMGGYGFLRFSLPML